MANLKKPVKNENNERFQRLFLQTVSAIGGRVRINSDDVPEHVKDSVQRKYLTFDPDLSDGKYCYYHLTKKGKEYSGKAF